MKPHIILFAFFLFSTRLLGQQIWYVNGAVQTPAPTGLSWALAFPNLDSALSTAQPGDEIWIAQGIYKPTDNTDRNARFVLPSGVGVFGGFAGMESTRAERNWDTHPTVLSGDIGAAGDSTDNSYCLVYAAATDSNTLIDGLIIERANANNTQNNTDYYRPTLSGAGVYLDGDGGLVGVSHLTVRNCVIRNNTAVYEGGGLYANGRGNGAAILQLENCIFQRNRAGSYGAGIALENYTSQSPPLYISGCQFIDNYGPGVGGSGMLISHEQPVHIQHCTFLRNKSFGAGAVFFYFNGNHANPIAFEDCTFEENTGADGAGIRVSLPFSTTSVHVYVSRCRFYGQASGAISLNANTQPHFFNVDNSIFYGNFGTSNVLSLQTNGASKAVFSHCLLYKNWSAAFSSPTPNKTIHLINTIVVDESGDGQVTLSNNVQVLLNHCLTPSSSCNLLGNAVVCDPYTLFNTDPQCIAPSPESTANFHLRPCSPAINAGLDAITDSLGIATDFDGNARIQNGRGDVGPYETNISLETAVVTQPSCAGASDGAFIFNGNICAPYTITWNNGTTTGSNLGGLIAGTYVCTITDANGHSFQQTFILPESPALQLEANANPVQCPGQATGFVELFIAGGTPGYSYSPNNPPLQGLAAGNYSYTVIDAHGCVATTTTVIEAPPPFQVFYTVQNASGPSVSDGAIRFDSITGGWNGAPTPNDLTSLLPGVYGITITDALGCTVVVSIPVGFTSSTHDAATEFSCKIFPNPTVSSASLTIESSEREYFEVAVFDLSGRLLLSNRFAPPQATVQTFGLAAGMYKVVITGESGKKTQRKWVVGNRP